MSFCEAKGEHHEAGPRATRVNEWTCGQTLPPQKIHFEKGGFFIWGESKLTRFRAEFESRSVM